MAIGDALTVTRDDIKDFPPATITMILDMQKQGWRAQRSNRNHVMLLAPDGMTRLSASRNAASSKYLGEELKRYNAKIPTQVLLTDGPKAPRFPCPRSGCNKVFNSLENLSIHNNVDHEGLFKCPDCMTFHKDSRRLNMHRARNHGYESPSKAKRLRQEAARKAKPTALALIEDRVDKLKAVAEEVIAEVEAELSEEIADDEDAFLVIEPEPRPLLKVERKDLVHAKLREVQKRGRLLDLQLRRAKLEARLLELEIEEIDAE